MTTDMSKKILDMTLEEKASLCSGADFWHTKEIKRLSIPSIMVSDGPHGLRKQVLEQDMGGFGESVQAVCFPSAVALASSFDMELLYRLGCALGEECQAEGVAVLLGPGVNMKRSPLCGRNFEYFSEDPYLAGKLASSYVQGVQSKQVGTSVKHFAANNQETRRNTISVDIEERTLREIYLTAFEIIVKEAKPWTIMCSYNCINDVYSCENDWLLNQVLRKEWGFDGLVVTDWGAMNDRVKAIQAGLDLEMPSCNGITDQHLIEAVQNQSLPEETLDMAVKRILDLVQGYEANKDETSSYDLEEHHNLSKEIATECAVLLKNESLLPLNPAMKVCFIGEFAKHPRYQGNGSSRINSFKVSCALDAAKEYSVTYAKGYDLLEEDINKALVNEARTKAKEAEVAVVFAGLPDHYESEGYDRKNLNLPMVQNYLIEEIVKVQPNTVVVLHNGSSILMPWANQVKAILEMYLAGQGVGEATVDLLYGKANPSGKLAESFPLRLQDTPSYLNFPGDYRTVSYKEGIFIGYRYYDALDIPVLFPFGHGLSYTSFEYSDLSLSVMKQKKVEESNQQEDRKEEPYKNLAIEDGDQLRVTLKVRNTGKVSGKEVVQLYVKHNKARVSRPPKELKGFAKISLEAGQCSEVSFILDQRSFAYYSTELHDWYAESGVYEIMVGASSRDLRLSESIKVMNSQKPSLILDDRTTLSDLLGDDMDDNSLCQLLSSLGFQPVQDVNSVEYRMLLEIMKSLPLHAFRSFAGSGLDLTRMDDMIQLFLSKS